MKKLNSGPHKRARARKVACTVSAAALMLGVSHAATVGLHFQLNYCGTPSYSGHVVTSAAFGISPNQWENLSEMGTGYNSSCPGIFFTLNEIVDTTTSTNGLNPLPNGSLNITWSGPTANFSNWGGYDRGGPHYDFGGSTVVPGEGEVYCSFIRDGVNFGPIDLNQTGSPGGNNTAGQPGYSIDLTGLKTVFTNTPYVIQLVGASDSMYHLTNAFIIDATHSTTQSVVYPNTAPVGDLGDTAWIRGHGGGLSTASGPLNTDHVIITGNKAQHSASTDGNKTDSINNASTIAGFIITDKPVVTMSPRPALLLSNDTATMRAIAIGVPPLSYQWRKDGTPISGATNLTYGITNVTKISTGGNFDLVVTNLYGSVTSKVAAVIVDHLTSANGPGYTFDSKPVGTNQDGYDFGAAWLGSSADSRGTNRTGVMKFTASDPNQITLPGAANFDPPTDSILFWMRSAGTITNLPGGVGATLFDRSSGGNGLIVVQKDDGALLVQTANGGINFSSVMNVSDNNWHHIAIINNSAGVTLYIDGALDQAMGPATVSWPVGQEIELGRSHDSSWRAYNGMLDDFRIYNRELAPDEIASIYTSDALVATNALMVRLNFDGVPAPGATISWGLSSAVLQSADNANGPYTDDLTATSPLYLRMQPTTRKFYRYRYTHTPTTIITNPYDM